MSDLNELLYTLSDNDIVPLPSGKSASIREMTGHEQRSFMNRAKLTNGMAIQELLSSCTISVNDIALPASQEERIKFVLDMLAVDRKALIFGIRRHSLGDEFSFSTKCPDCGVKETWEVNLADVTAFPVTTCPNGDQRNYQYDSTVRPGLTIRFHLLDGAAEMAILRRRTNIDIFTDLELRSPHALNKGVQEVWVPIQLNKLPDSLIAELRKVIRAQEGDVQTSVKVICEACQNEVEFDLLQVPDFMIPSVTS